MGRRGRRLAAAGACVLALASGPAAAEAPQIPLRPGLVEVSAIHARGEDYEVLRTVEAMDDATVTFRLHRVDPEETGREPLTIMRVVRREDLRSANRMIAYFHTQDPELFPGSTAFQASAALIEKLKTGAETPFVFGTAAGPFGLLGARKYFRGNLRLVEPQPVAFPVLLNGQRTTLPALHAKGTLAVGNDAGEAEFWWLDQPDHATTLRWSFKDASSQVVRIDTPAPLDAMPDATVQAALGSEGCRAELHGVYFQTGSAALLPASAATIAEIAAVLQGEPAWRVTIEGHTDSIGSEEDNQDLSQRRAEAVRLALVDGHGIAADRLASAGFGEFRPIESNDTIEGRARNRRVELVRECP